jgi:hypothetical protein
MTLDDERLERLKEANPRRLTPSLRHRKGTMTTESLQLVIANLPEIARAFLAGESGKDAFLKDIETSCNLLVHAIRTMTPEQIAGAIKAQEQP